MAVRRIWATLLALCMLALCPAAATGDAAGALSEGELNAWLSQALLDSAKEQPLNAPVGEESRTEDGYAFLYSFATLYYDKPTLDAQSKLQAVSLTDDGYAAPRGLRLGSSATELMDSFGWQNPLLLGDGLFAPLYRLNNLPAAAYWGLAQLEGGALRSVQLGVHARVADGRYTDAGMRFTLEAGAIGGIQIYGLAAVIGESDALRNLATVAGVESAISGDATRAPSAVGYAERHEADAFSRADLRFGGMDALALTEAGATKLFGEPLGEETATDDTGERLKTVRRDGLTLSFASGADGAMRLDTLVLTKDLVAGPRGLRVGASTLNEAIAAFGSDGEGRTLGDAAILYGDGQSAPTGLLQRSPTGATLRYLADGGALASPLTLSMTFTGDILSEIMIYAW